MKIFRKRKLIAVFLTIGLFCSFQFVHAGTRTNLNAKGDFDNLFNIPVVIDVQHHKIHKGNHFEVHVETGISSAASLACAFRVPAGNKRTHVVIDWKAEDKAHIEVLEGAIWSTDTGSVITIYNNNRNSTTTSQLEEDKTATPAWTANSVLKNPTGIIGGTALHTDYSYVVKQAGGATSLPRHEWILKNDETYVIKVTNDAGGNKLLGIVMHFYEHKDR